MERFHKITKKFVNLISEFVIGLTGPHGVEGVELEVGLEFVEVGTEAIVQDAVKQLTLQGLEVAFHDVGLHNVAPVGNNPAVYNLQNKRFHGICVKVVS